MIKQKSIKAIILAAGKGVRMRSDKPKVLHQVCQKPVIGYVLDIVSSLTPHKPYVVLGHKSGEVQNFLGERIIPVLQTELLGTADAVKRTAAHFRGYTGDVLILCGDTPLLRRQTIQQLISFKRRRKAAAVVLGARLDQPQGYGRLIQNRQGQLTAIREEKDASVEERAIREINVGVYCFEGPTLFAALKKIQMNPQKKEYYLTDIIEILHASGQNVQAYLTPDPAEGWGVNTRRDLALAASLMRRRVIENLMDQGVTIEDPETTYIAADARIGQDTIIRACSVIESDVRIGKRCQIGPFCRLRPGVRLADDVEVGNFAEVSRTQMGAHGFMKHFGFLGDARLGRHVNVGAGVVTANFDGKEKHLTRVADHVFLGSDSILVAPLKIGKRAVTGAGSVLTSRQVIPAGAVVAGVPARKLLKRGAHE